MPTTVDPRLRKRTAGGRPKVGLAPRRNPPCLPGFASAAAAAAVEAKAGEQSASLSASCSSACAVSEVSINSKAGVGKQSSRPTGAAAARRRKWEVDGIEVIDVGIGGEVGRRITRSYYKQKKGEKPVRGEELSDVSCAESIPGVGRLRFSKRRASSIGEVQEEKKPSKISRLGNRIGDNSNSAAVASFSEKNKTISKVDVSEISWLESISESKVSQNAEIVAKGATSNCSQSAPGKNSEYEFECDSGKPRARVSNVKLDEENSISKIGVTDTTQLESVPEEIKAAPNAANVEEKGIILDLACSEKLMPGDESELSPSEGLTLSDLDSEFFLGNSYEETDFSEFTTQSSPSGSDFSQNSGTNYAPSASFQLFLHYMKQFVRISSSSEVGLEDEFHRGFTLMKFEEEEFEESYQRFRCREKRQVLFDYDGGVDGGAAEEYGEMVFHHRLLMVKWMVEHSEECKLQPETLFLGVSLLDRFLGRGFFKSTRDIEILGISCCTLAIRMEENQSYNCIRRRTFNVGSNVYNRSEVVAMEWMVQEVLKFQCLLPTTYNFLCFYLKAAKANCEVENRAKYLAVISLLDHERLFFWPSTVAAGLVILASLAVNREHSCNRVMETHVRTKNDDLAECIQSLEWLVKYVY